MAALNKENVLGYDPVKLSPGGSWLRLEIPTTLRMKTGSSQGCILIPSFIVVPFCKRGSHAAQTSLELTTELTITLNF